MQMRQLFEEGDLVVEVHELFAGGAMSLHTRSLTYGKVNKCVLCSGVRGSHCRPASERATHLRTPHSYQTVKVAFRLATLQRRSHLGVERIHLGQRTHRPDPITRRRRAGCRIRVLKSKRGVSLRADLLVNPSPQFFAASARQAVDRPT